MLARIAEKRSGRRKEETRLSQITTGSDHSGPFSCVYILPSTPLMDYNKLMIESFSSSIKIALPAIILGLLVSGGAVYAATILLNANQVGFDKTGTSLTSTDVQGALNELHTRVSTWVDPSGAYMQDFDKSKLPNVNDSMTLTDRRDGNRYTIKRLKDGNIWMTQNLRIGKSTTMTLTSDDSDVESSYTLPASDVSQFTNAGFGTQAIYVDPTYGGYYTNYAARADSTVRANSEIPHSICPKGWRMPTYTEYTTLLSKYNSSYEMMQSEPGFMLGGTFCHDSIPQDQDANYWYWTSTTSRTSDLVYLMKNTNTTPYFGGYYGATIRCIAR